MKITDTRVEKGVLEAREILAHYEALTKYQKKLMSERQLAVFRLRAKGLTMQKIADKMGVSKPRVGQQIKMVKKKWNDNSIR